MGPNPILLLQGRVAEWFKAPAVILGRFGSRQPPRPGTDEGGDGNTAKPEETGCRPKPFGEMAESGLTHTLGRRENVTVPWVQIPLLPPRLFVFSSFSPL